MDPEKRETWEYQLNAPLPGRERQVSEQVVEAEGQAFMAAMAQHQAFTGQGG